jgi:phospholipid/cholesterol/gamma-HCH transport system substrate-binding protein
MTSKTRALELRVGILIAVALVVLGGFIFVLGNFSLGKGYELAVDFDFSGNLQPGAPVKVSGIKVGKVEDVIFMGGQLDPDVNRRVQVRAKLWLQERASDAVRENAKFYVSTAGVLGEQYVEIAPGSWDRPALGPDKKVVGENPPRTDLIISQLYEFLSSTTAILNDDKDLLRNLLKNSSEAVATLDQLLVDNRAQLSKLIVSSAQLADEASGLISDVRKGLGDPHVIGRSLGHAEQTLAGAERAMNELTPRAAHLLDEGTRVTGLITQERVERILAAADSATGLITKAKALVTNVDGMVTDLRAGKGTAGALLVRDELYADIKEMVRDLKRNPWKFLWKE